ncbi:hypothetical protein [Pectobacterium versatile]|uniref:hypothetical protein n=1 Tax=Pectobacterium versatile TaxID=2488639 RepID=UPI001F44FFEC|nr:hypothetical protein [Pectobacterium versatile]
MANPFVDNKRGYIQIGGVNMPAITIAAYCSVATMLFHEWKKLLLRQGCDGQFYHKLKIELMQSKDFIRR